MQGCVDEEYLDLTESNDRAGYTGYAWHARQGAMEARLLQIP
jgi:hypothetical protein